MAVVKYETMSKSIDAFALMLYEKCSLSALWYRILSYFKMSSVGQKKISQNPHSGQKYTKNFTTGQRKYTKTSQQVRYNMPKPLSRSDKYAKTCSAGQVKCAKTSGQGR